MFTGTTYDDKPYNFYYDDFKYKEEFKLYLEKEGIMNSGNRKNTMKFL